MYKYRRVPVDKLKSKIDVKKYDKPAPLKKDLTVNTDIVRISLKQHIGAKSIPVVFKNQKIKQGELIADIPEKQLGAKIHSSLTGTVTDITENHIEIKKI